MKWIMFFVPHFVNEDVVFDVEGDSIYPVCCLDDVKEGEYFPYVGTIRSFAFLNIGFFPKMIGELRDYHNPTS